ncbi:MAG: Uma2 family endonuclease [Chloroflexi bacterium]|nr:Uma2 family endonuclease [Chloroflexota bacterium]
MALNIPALTSAEEFERVAEQPENADKILELIAGEVVEVPSNIVASIISSRINRRIGEWVETHDLGFVTGEAGGYRVEGDRYAPDVAFIRKDRQIATRGYNPDAPDLAVEVDYPSDFDSQRRLRYKVTTYMAAGTVCWLVFPETRTVEVYVPGQAHKTLTEADTLDGAPVLPGFKLAVKDIFPPLPEVPQQSSQ